MVKILEHIYMSKLYTLAALTGKPPEWHIIQAVKKYLIQNKMMSDSERLTFDRSDCMTPCIFFAGNESCRGCKNYISERERRIKK